MICNISAVNQGRGKNSSWLAHERLGYNYRLSDINCAMGIVQLSRIEDIKAKRKQVALWYQESLSGEERIIVPAEGKEIDLNWFVFVIRLKENFTFEQRNSVIENMAKAGVQTSNYFSPVHLQPFIAEQLGCKSGDFPATEAVSQRTIALPFYNNLSKEDISLVCEELKKCLDSL